MNDIRRASPHEQSEILMQALPHRLCYDDATIVVKWRPRLGTTRPRRVISPRTRRDDVILLTQDHVASDPCNFHEA